MQIINFYPKNKKEKHYHFFFLFLKEKINLPLIKLSFDCLRAIIIIIRFLDMQLLKYPSSYATN